LTALCLIAAVTLAGTAAADASSSPPASSFSAVKGALTSALKIKTIPSNLTPSLAAVASKGTVPFIGASWLAPSCTPEIDPSDAADPQPCWFGDKSAKRTVVLFGDSFVSNWLPALAGVAKALKYRVAAFEFSGCVTPFVGQMAYPTFPEADVELCAQWHTNLPASVIKLKPAAVIAVNGFPDQGPIGDPVWVAGMALAFQELTAGLPKTHRILLGTGPDFATSRPECLAANPTDIQSCTLSYSPAASDPFGAALLRDAAMAKASNAVLVPTVQWFCVKDRCPSVVANRLVYIDWHHTTIVYSEYLTTVLRVALSKVL
jgi:SGNH domain (fused to AT3 domains)